jgi:hypothetical protein
MYMIMSCGLKCKLLKCEVLPLQSMIKVNSSLISCLHGYTFLRYAKIFHYFTSRNSQLYRQYEMQHTDRLGKCVIPFM